MPTITPDQCRAAKASLLADLQRGYSVLEAHRRVTIPLHRTTLYRFRRRMQADPVAALEGENNYAHSSLQRRT